MGLFKKKADPLSERSRELKSEIAALEAQIKKLSSQAEQPSSPRAVSMLSSSATAVVSTPATEPVFEPVGRTRLDAPPEVEGPEHYNQHGVRKFDLPGLIRRIQDYWKPKPAMHPKLVTLLAAGSIQGLRPLRYERRIARTRFVVTAAIFLAILWGLIVVLLRR